MITETLEGRERHIILKSLSLALAALDATGRAMRAESDMVDIEALLVGLAGETERELYASSALNVIAAIVDRQACRVEG